LRSALVVGALGGAPPQPLHPTRQLVAEQLELLQAEHARTRGRCRRRTGARAGDGGARRGRVLRREVGKRLGDGCGELALEPRDLSAQRTPRGALAILAGSASAAIDG